MSALLDIRDLKAFYGDFQALFGVSLHIDAGECVALVGANGAGKSTLLRCLTGLLPIPGENVLLKGENIAGLPAHELARRGIAMAPEGRRLFPSLSVEENLLVGGYKAGARNWSLERVYDLFPVLAEHRHRPATRFSGGQQQMVAIGRALMRNPRILLLDEISLGLAPTVIKDIYAAMPVIRENGTAVILVEQDIAQASAVSDRLYCLQEGHVTLVGRPQDLTRAAISAAYFGRESAA